MASTRFRLSIAATALATVLLGGLAAAPASATSGADPSPTTTGSFEFNCNGTPGGGARVSWERVGTKYTATIDEYRLSPAHGDTNQNGEVLLRLTGGDSVWKKSLTADGGWHALGATATTTAASDAAIEHAFTFVYAGFPTYPQCAASKWL
ncbi:hypothetical protein EDF24_0993 [Curtobacterium sp. PhB130]|uniref:hypothetical protein n=1 Tax=Curtobacterium sp. PhB130 TaxID=2485178 RepID=UPI000F4B2CBB|nr:hypothetical protein [Curtobacterium sp. PhB130]ROS78221.1 hypothetical protein EDF24_0993 [Curtobacterium sp. PhB130]